MKKVLTKNNNFLFAYLCICSFMICAAFDIESMGVILKVAAIFFFVLFLFDKNEKKIDFEKMILSVIVLLYLIVLLLSGKVLPINLVSIAVVGMYPFIHWKELELKKWFMQNAFIILVILLFVLFSIEVVGAWAMWDARVYYSFPYGSYDIQALVKSFNRNLSNFDNLFLASHVSIGYSFWLLLFQLMKDGVEAVHIADILLAGISIFAYYQILKKLLGDKYSNKILAIGSVPYAFSPFVLGMVGNIDVDHPSMYFATILIACSIYRYECLELAMATCFCLTKEPAVFYYVIYMIVKIICDYVQTESFNLRRLLKHMLFQMRHYRYTLPVFLFGIFYLHGGWGRNGMGSDTMHVFGINQKFVTMKLKQVFFLNFNWIFWLLLITASIVLCRKKMLHKKEVCVALPIFSLGLAVIVFGCSYITCTHVRYILPFIPVLYLVSTVLMGILWNKRFATCSIFISSLLLIQSFWSIDPVMDKIFPSMAVGSGRMYSMYEYNIMQFHDSIVYNRQSMYWQQVLHNIMKESGYNGDMLIVLPNDDNCSRYHLLGDHETLWDFGLRTMDYYDEFEENTEKVFIEVAYVDSLREYSGNLKKYLYIIPKWGTIDKKFLGSCIVEKEGEVKYRGFNVQYMVMELKE